MENCENYLWTLGENIILKNRINRIENQAKYNSLDLSPLDKYKIGQITLSDQFVVKQIEFTSESFNSLMNGFVGQSYSDLINTSSYEFQFPVFNTTQIKEPQLLSCISKWYDNAIAIIVNIRERNELQLYFYGQNSNKAGSDIGNLKMYPLTSFQPLTYLLNAIIEHSQNSIFILNPRRELQLINSNGKQLLNNYFKKYPDTGEIFDRYIVSNHLKKYLQCIKEASNGKSTSEEVVVRTPQGKQEWFDYHYFPVLNNENEVLFLLLVFHNKTRARIIERKYYETKLRADETDRLKKAFLNSMSHEIRTPMNGIMGFADLINRPSLPEDKKQKYATLIRDNGKTLLNAFEEIMDIARMESGEMIVNEVQFDINKLFDDILFYCKNQFFTKKHANIKLTCNKNYNRKQVMIYADKGKIKQIMLNLLSNSFRNTLCGHIDFGYYFDNQGLLNLYTSDSGKGISYKHRKLVHQQESHTDLISHQSVGEMKAGMGLSIVKGYVEFLNGNLQLHSQKRLGSVFKIQLPLANHIINSELPITITHKKEVFAYFSEHHLKGLKPVMNVLIGQYKVHYYNIANFPSLNGTSKKLIFFHAGQKLSLIKQIIDQINQEEHTFLYFSDQPTQEEKEICFSYGIHEYLSYDLDTAYFTNILNKYVYY